MSISSDVQTQLKVLTAGINLLIAESVAKDQRIIALQDQVAALRPAPVFTWTNINEKPGWLAPGNVGDTGGGSSAVAGHSTLTLGHPLIERFTAGHPWNNAYIYLQLDQVPTDSGIIISNPGLQQLTNFKVSLSLSLPAEKKVWQALEFELQLAAKGWVYNQAWQWLPDGSLRAFQFIQKVWANTGLVFQAADLDAGRTVNLVAEFHVDQDRMKETHTRLTVNGSVFPVQFSQPAESGSGTYLHAAFQVDSDKAMDPYTLAVDNMSVEAS